MQVKIEAYWSAKVSSIPESSKLTAEEVLKNRPVVICSIVIDGKFRGNVQFDGEKLLIEPFNISSLFLG